MFFRVLAAMLTADAIDRHRRAQQQLELLQAHTNSHCASMRGEVSRADAPPRYQHKQMNDRER